MDTSPVIDFKLSPLIYNDLIDRLVTNKSTFDYAIKLFHRSKLSSKESNARLNESIQHRNLVLIDDQNHFETDMAGQKRRRGVFTSGGIIFPEARAAMFLPPTSGERDIQINTFTQTMDRVTNNASNIDAFKISALGYLHFVTIHPFGFGNGRVANEVANFTLKKMGEKVFLPRPLFSEDKKKWKSVLSGIYSYMVGIGQDNPGFYSSIEDKSRHDWDVMLKYCQQVKDMPISRIEFPQKETVSKLADLFRSCSSPT